MVCARSPSGRRHIPTNAIPIRFSTRTPLLSRPAIGDLLLCRCIHFFRREQRCGPEVRYSAGIHRQRKRSDGDIVRQVRYADEVRLTKCEVEGFEPASRFLDERLSGLSAFRSTVFAEALCALRAVTALNEILRHGTPPFVVIGFRKYTAISSVPWPCGVEIPE